MLALQKEKQSTVLFFVAVVVAVVVECVCVLKCANESIRRCWCAPALCSYRWRDERQVDAYTNSINMSFLQTSYKNYIHFYLLLQTSADCLSGPSSTNHRNFSHIRLQCMRSSTIWFAERVTDYKSMMESKSNRTEQFAIQIETHTHENGKEAKQFVSKQWGNVILSFELFYSNDLMHTPNQSLSHSLSQFNCYFTLLMQNCGFNRRHSSLLPIV